MKTHQVAITETLEMIVEVEAPGCREAERLVEKRWADGEYVLDADRFAGVTFRAEPRKRERDHERRISRADAERERVFSECNSTASNVFG
jgi:hypothetical protein